MVGQFWQFFNQFLKNSKLPEITHFIRTLEGFVEVDLDSSATMCIRMVLSYLIFLETVGQIVIKLNHIFCIIVIILTRNDKNPSQRRE